MVRINVVVSYSSAIHIISPHLSIIVMVGESMSWRLEVGDGVTRCGWFSRVGWVASCDAHVCRFVLGLRVRYTSDTLWTNKADVCRELCRSTCPHTKYVQEREMPTAWSRGWAIFLQRRWRKQQCSWYYVHSSNEDDGDDCCWHCCRISMLVSTEIVLYRLRIAGEMSSGRSLVRAFSRCSALRRSWPVRLKEMTIDDFAWFWMYNEISVFRRCPVFYNCKAVPCVCIHMRCAVWYT